MIDYVSSTLYTCRYTVTARIYITTTLLSPLPTASLLVLVVVDVAVAHTSSPQVYTHGNIIHDTQYNNTYLREPLALLW